MLNSAILDTVIGLLFVYLTLALMCTVVCEWIAQFFDLRAKTLAEGIENLLARQPSGGSSISPAEVNPVKLLARLTAPGDRLAAALGLDSASSPAAVSVTEAELPAIRAALADRVNQALGDPLLHEKIDLAKASRSAIANSKKSQDSPARERANATLLRQAYPEEFGSLAWALYSHPLIRSLSRRG